MVAWRLSDQVWRQVCERYEMPTGAEIELLGGGANQVYRIHTTGYAERALCLYRRGARTDQAICAELMVLAYLDRTTDLAVPSPIADRSGQLLTAIDPAHTLGPTQAAMFSWVSGKTLGEVEPTVDRMFLVGQTLGQLDVALQRADETIVPRPSLSKPRQDGVQVINWAVEQFTQYHTGNRLLRKLRSQRKLDPTIREISDRLRRVYKRLSPSLPHQLLHSDAHFGNLLFDGTRIGIVDFDGMGYGVRAYELTPPLHSLYELAISGHPSVHVDSLPDLIEALLDGYRCHVSLSRVEERSLSAIQALRLFSALAWHASRQDVPASKEWPEQYSTEMVAKILGLLDGYKESGVMNRSKSWVRTVAEAHRWSRSASRHANRNSL